MSVEILQIHGLIFVHVIKNAIQKWESTSKIFYHFVWFRKMADIQRNEEYNKVFLIIDTRA